MKAQPGLDIEHSDSLVTYLRETGRISDRESPRVSVLPGGVSNRTVLVEREGGERWVLKQALPKLRVAVDWFSPPERIEREAEGMRWLGRLLPHGSVPVLLFQDPREHLLAMSAVPSPHRNWKSLLLAGEVEPPHVEQFARMLAGIHSSGLERRDEIARAFQDRSFFESLRLEPYYEYTARQLPAAAGFLDELLRSTRETRLTLVHGDYSPKNILVHAGCLVLIDHEVIHFGDPAFDLGFALTHLLSKAHHLPACRAQLAEAARFWWRTYRDTVPGASWTAPLEGRAVSHTLACLLARVAGRSTLEYLTPAEKDRQRLAVLELISRAPGNIIELIDAFVRRIS